MGRRLRRPTNATARRWQVARWLAVLATLLLALPVVPAARATVPSGTDYFEYDYNTYLDQGGGNYSGYTEQQTSHYRYNVVAVQGAVVTMTGSGSYQFQNSSGAMISGNWAGTFAFSTTTRSYTQGFDVLANITNPSVWFWIATPVAVGDTLRLLDLNYTVRSLDSTVWLGTFPPVPRVGIELESTGTYVRNDIYGYYDANYDDRFWFDPSTGFVLAEYYQEFDSGPQGSFQWREQVFTTAASFPMPLDWVQLVAVYGGVPALVVAVVYPIRRFKVGPRRVPNHPGGGVRAFRVRGRRRLRQLQALRLPDALTIAPFARTNLRRALGLRDPAYVAVGPNGLEGLFVYDRKLRVGSLAATDASVARTFLSMKHAANVFVEYAPGVPLAAPNWYSELARFEILEWRDRHETLIYDPTHVRPMQPGDLPAVRALAEQQSAYTEERQLVAALADGDIAYVAIDPEHNAEIVGFGLATVGDGAGLLYGLTVAEQARHRGLGTELVTARILALRQMGIDRVRMEVARDNLPPHLIANKLGFVKVTELLYATRSQMRQHDSPGRPIG